MEGFALTRYFIILSK